MQQWIQAAFLLVLRLLACLSEPAGLPGAFLHQAFVCAWPIFSIELGAKENGQKRLQRDSSLPLSSAAPLNRPRVPIPTMLNNSFLGIFWSGLMVYLNDFLFSLIQKLYLYIFVLILTRV